MLALSRLRPLPSAVGRPDRRGPCADAAAGAVETLLVRAVGIHRPDLGHVASRLARCVEEHELPAVGRPVGNTGAAASRLGVDQLNVGPVRVGDFDAMGAVEGEFAPVGRSLRIRSVSDRGQMRPVRTDGVDPGRSARDAFEDQKTAFGDQLGSTSSHRVRQWVRRCGLPPSAPTTQTDSPLRGPSRLNAIQRPLGDQPSRPAYSRPHEPQEVNRLEPPPSAGTT